MGMQNRKISLEHTNNIFQKQISNIGRDKLVSKLINLEKEVMCRNKGIKLIRVKYDELLGINFIKKKIREVII